jgi:hypothetical protein
MLVSVVVGYGRLETRITVLEASDIAREKSTAVETASRMQYQLEMKQDVREIRQDIKTLGSLVQNTNTTVKKPGRDE